MKAVPKTLAQACLRANLICATFMVLWIVSSGFQPVVAAPKTCESLAQLVLPNTKITTAQAVTSGEFHATGKVRKH